MKTALALLLALLPSVSAAAGTDAARDLTPGQYELKVSGLLCWACARGVAQELSALPGVEKATADFDRQAVELTVKSGRLVTAARLRRALKKAERLVNLGARYTIASIDYRVAPIVPGPDRTDPKNKARQ